MVSTAFGMYAEPLSAAYGAVTGALETFEKIDGLLTLTPAAKKEPPELKAGANTQVDWKGLLDTALTAFRKYVDQTRSINAIKDECQSTLEFLSDVALGDRPAGARATPDGKNADHIAKNAAAATADLQSVGTRAISGDAVKLAADVKAMVAGTTVRKLEQDIAMKWIASLSKDDLETISEADAYLKELGVINSHDNRLGVDTGWYTNDVEEKVVWMRARLNTHCMTLVGKRAEWLGGSKLGGVLQNARIRVDGEEWNAGGGGNLEEKAGGTVLITGYTLGPVDAAHLDGKHDDQMLANLRDRVRIFVRHEATPVSTASAATP